MDIPEGIGWKAIREGLAQLDVKGINHFSFGFPEGEDEKQKTEIKDFFLGMGSILELEEVEKTKETEWFVYPEEKKLGYEHLLWARPEKFFHLEIDVQNTAREIQRVFPDSIEEQPGMFWVTVHKNFLDILWAVILTNKRAQK